MHLLAKFTLIFYSLIVFTNTLLLLFQQGKPLWESLKIQCRDLDLVALYYHHA